MFLPDDVDGRVLFNRATARIKALQEGREPEMPTGGLGDVVMVPPVVEARGRGSCTPSDRLLASPKPGSSGGMDGDRGGCRHLGTGFRSALDHAGSPKFFRRFNAEQPLAACLKPQIAVNQALMPVTL